MYGAPAAPICPARPPPTTRGAVSTYALPYAGAYRPVAVDRRDGMSDPGQFFPGTSAWVFLSSRTGGQLGFTQGATWSSGPAAQVALRRAGVHDRRERETGLWHGRDYGADHAFSFYWGGYGDVALGAHP